MAIKKNEIDYTAIKDRLLQCGYDERVAIIESLEDKIIHCTAWDTIADLSQLIDDSHQIRIKGGKVYYECATPTKGYQTVRLVRLDTTPDMGLRQVSRIVPATTPVELWPIEITRATH